MISAPTTFVIGAGASRPYHLPVGSGLIDQARMLNMESPIVRLLSAVGVTSESVADFLKDLRSSPVKSLDTFIETRKSDAVKVNVGKAAIAALMGKAICEAASLQPDSSCDWIRDLVTSGLQPGAATWLDCATNNDALRFVTFNFDSVIEDQLVSLLGRTYAHSNRDAIRRFVTDRIVHVHGQLPPTPVRDTFDPTLGGSAIDRDWLEWLTGAKESVSVVSDKIPPAVVDRACEFLHDRRRVCFLGFSYQVDNLRRLDVPSRSPTAA